MTYIARYLEPEIKSRMFSGKAIIVYGPRQCGKTTMIRHITSPWVDDVIWLNGDSPDVRAELDRVTVTRWKLILGKKKILVLDEAQRIPNVGLALKLITDEIPEVQIIASGSSSFELADKTSEPLTGRKFEYRLLPLSFSEMVAQNGLLAEKQCLEQRLLFGAYPDIVTHLEDSARLLSELVGSYLFKDIYALDGLKKTKILDNLVKALAMQVGSEVSLNELASLTGTDRKTVETYIDLLEKTYVVFSLGAYSGNLRNEIKKGKKIYFYDLGVRNAVMGNFSSIDSRTDKGALWENYLILERLKNTLNQPFPPQQFFWRTTAPQSKEVDYLEKTAQTLCAWEMKANPASKARIPLSFRKAYPDAQTEILTPDNYDTFLLKS
ncbi:MAG: ATP-binding protein [Clostridia bacterium]|nr:ATP-binding protein [Clostridia bacterium]